MNQGPIYWYSKKQETVETATYSSEFVAARTCVEQIIDIRMTLRYLGVPIQGCTHIFGDNESVVNNSMIFEHKLYKRHTTLSIHRVREAISASICQFHHLSGKYIPADILSKHWGYNDVWSLLKPLMFWEGNVGTIPSIDDNK